MSLMWWFGVSLVTGAGWSGDDAAWYIGGGFWKD